MVQNPHDKNIPTLHAGPRLRSLFWERTVLSVLERVERLPTNVQGEIATRVGKYINLAQTARGDAATLRRFIEAAAGERAKVAPGGKSTGDPRWTAPALAEAWSISRLGLSNGNLNRLSAMSVITAIEAFASERAASFSVSKGRWPREEPVPLARGQNDMLR